MPAKALRLLQGVVVAARNWTCPPARLPKIDWESWVLTKLGHFSELSNRVDFLLFSKKESKQESLPSRIPHHQSWGDDDLPKNFLGGGVPTRKVSR